MLKFILCVLLCTTAFSSTYEIVNAPYYSKDAPELVAIMAQLKPYGEFSPKKTETTETPPKTLSKGEQAVEEAKARNRAILAEMNKKEKEAPQDKDTLAEWKAEVKATQAGWKKEVADSLAQWKKEQEIFLGRLKVYKENTFELPVKKEKIVEKKVVPDNVPDLFVVNSTFSVPVRDQRDRATCSAFAGLRAVEILLAQNQIQKDLSEQYFYWSSKPNCQTKPCTEKGSWVTPGLRHSQKVSSFDVPLEEGCAYKTVADHSNETQIPLTDECKQGSVKVLDFVQIKTLAEVIEKLKANTPVIMAAKLSENFYKNQGLVMLHDSAGTGVKLDEHSKGHAFLAVGVIELPEKLKALEGHYCILVANSWGQGWGAGGHACLTEKWLTKFRQPSPFVAVTKVSVR